MFCPRCGVQNADDHNFCAACGAPLPAGGPAAGAPPPGYTAQPAPPPPYPPGAAPPYPQPPYGTMPRARRTNILAIAIFGLLMLAVGVAAAYVLLKGSSPGTIALPFGQGAMDSYADPQGRFKIRYPRGWTVRPLSEFTVFYQQALPGNDFSLGQITAATILAVHPQKSAKDITADQALTEAGLMDAHTQVLGKRLGKVSTASGEAEAEWVDFLATPEDKQLRGRVISEVRHRGDGTALKGIAVCLSPPEAFASFDRLCSSALDAYELGTL